MRTHLEFRSDRLAGGANGINPDIFGANLAEFLDERFKTLGYSGGIVEEDWGWMVRLASEPFNLWLGCASYDNDGEWLVFIEPSKPYAGSWFRKTGARPLVDKVATQLEDVLRAEGGGTDLRWWSDQDSGR